MTATYPTGRIDFYLQAEAKDHTPSGIGILR